MEKKLVQITVHISSDEEAVFRRLAEAEGQSGSELGHRLICEYIESKRAYLECLTRAFSAQENQEN